MEPFIVSVMDVPVTLRGPSGLADQIYWQLRAAILDGRLGPGSRLPSTRGLAGRLAVGRNTVLAAYDRLAAEGFLVGRVGAGSYVSAAIEPAAPPRRAPAGDLRPRPVWATPWTLPIPNDPDDADPLYDFRLGIPDAELFPFTAWRRLVAEQLQPSRMPTARYGDPAGDARLRRAIARHVGVARMVQAHADDLIITNGVQQALDLIGRVLVDPGTVVAVEDPGYPPASRLFQSLGAHVVPVPVDGEGLRVAELPTAARIVYVTPSHQFPLGVTMSLPRRMALLGWARRRRVAVVEDDYDSEFRFAGRPLEPLQTLDRDGRVLYVGSLSKTLLPSLRLGYLVAPSSLRPALRAAKLLSDWHTPWLNQAALAHFIDDGLLARHVSRTHRVYRARRGALDAALRTHAARWLEPVPSIAGLHVTALFRHEHDVDVDAVIGAARDRGVAVEAVASYTSHPRATPGLALGYGAIPAERIDEGIRILAHCIHQQPRPREAPRRRQR
jgi:GntR family transcriptional regulator/MocR family aminotransferase